LNQWQTALDQAYDITIESSVPTKLAHAPNTYTLIILDVTLITDISTTINEVKKAGATLLLIGQQWPEPMQIDALVTGASGYCDFDISPTLITKAVESVINGEIWIRRHLIPQVIGSLVQRNPPAPKQEPAQDINALIKTLSRRELDVAKLIRVGKSNKRIANTLHISERTVKAHLTSIFKKMEVADRLHLAVSLKGFDI